MYCNFSNLRDMEENGLLTRKVYAEVPPRVEYTLTETGYSLKPIMDAMVEWGTEYKTKIRESKPAFKLHSEFVLMNCSFKIF